MMRRGIMLIKGHVFLEKGGVILSGGDGQQLAMEASAPSREALCSNRWLRHGIEVNLCRNRLF